MTRDVGCNSAHQAPKRKEGCLEPNWALEAEGAPLPDFPDLPQREVRAGEYRIFFRRAGTALWITGVWKTKPS